LTYQIHNNTTYQFRVLAYNGFANSDSSNVISLTPEGPATTIAAPAHTSVIYGHRLTLSTKLTRSSNHAGIGTAIVHLQQRLGTGPFTSAGAATTSSGGTAQVTVTPTQNTSYRWVFNGNGSFAPSSSAAVSITVDQAVTAKASTSSVRHGKPVEIHGSVEPGKSGGTVTLELRVGSSWKKVGSGKLPTGKTPPGGPHDFGYVITYRPSKAGKEQLRVVYAATAINGAGASPIVRLTVS
jgi:hypothetical protein